MFLIEIFLPLDRRDGSKVASDRIEAIVACLADRFGGATAFLRSPAKGLWKQSGTELEEDRIVIVEVMAAEVDVDWWRNYRVLLEEEFLQDEILIRAMECRVL